MPPTEIADGINFHTGVTDSTVRNNFVRNIGDDGLAMWSQTVDDARDIFDHNTVPTPVLANGIAIYGGSDNTVSLPKTITCDGRPPVVVPPAPSAW